MLSFYDITGGYPALLSHIMDNGQVLSPRGMPITEITGASFVLEDISRPLVLQKARKLNYAYTMLEPYLLLSPQNHSTVEACCFYVGKFLTTYVVDPKSGLMDGWYGDRFASNNPNEHHLLKVFEILRADPDSRRAVITINDSKIDLFRPESRDIPCTLTIQYLLRNNRLNCIVNMRSNDAILGTPQNVAMFTFFQRMLAAWLGVKHGQYQHNVGSLHIYERDYAKAQLIIDSPGELEESPYLCADQYWEMLDPYDSLEHCKSVVNCERTLRSMAQRPDASAEDLSAYIDRHFSAGQIRNMLQKIILPKILKRAKI